MDISTKYEKHGGSLSVGDLHLLKRLDEKSRQLENSHVRAKIAPDIRQQSRVELPQGKLKFNQ